MIRNSFLINQTIIMDHKYHFPANLLESSQAELKLSYILVLLDLYLELIWLFHGYHLLGEKMF